MCRTGGRNCGALCGVSWLCVVSWLRLVHHYTPHPATIYLLRLTTCRTPSPCLTPPGLCRRLITCPPPLHPAPLHLLRLTTCRTPSPYLTPPGLVQVTVTTAHHTPPRQHPVHPPCMRRTCGLMSVSAMYEADLWPNVGECHAVPCCPRPFVLKGPCCQFSSCIFMNQSAVQHSSPAWQSSMDFICD